MEDVCLSPTMCINLPAQLAVLQIYSTLMSERLSPKFTEQAFAGLPRRSAFEACRGVCVGVPHSPPPRKAGAITAGRAPLLLAACEERGQGFKKEIRKAYPGTNVGQCYSEILRLELSTKMARWKYQILQT